jgi:hypothetical protein
MAEDVPPGDGDTERDEDASAAVARRLNPLTTIVREMRLFMR